MGPGTKRTYLEELGDQIRAAYPRDPRAAVLAAFCIAEAGGEYGDWLKNVTEVMRALGNDPEGLINIPVMRLAAATVSPKRGQTLDTDKEIVDALAAGQVEFKPLEPTNP